MRHLAPVALVLIPLAFLVSGHDARGATPPALINYQGVLRDSNNIPLDGPYDMTFRFFDALSGGNEILIDAHLISAGKGVIVSNGLFSVALGGGDVADGSGPGTFTSLTEVFAAYDAVFMEIQVGSETLAPRTRVLASAYAQNAARLEGRAAAEFVDTSSSQQIKTGSIVVGTTAPINFAVGVEGQGVDMGGYFSKASGQGYAYLGGYADIAIYGAGRQAGGFLKDLDDTSYVNLASAGLGVNGAGTFAGGQFQDLDSSGRASIAVGDVGVSATGNSMGGFFSNADGSGYANLGVDHKGIEGLGNEMGGYFMDRDATSYCYAAKGDRGVEGHGAEMGGFFSDLNGSGLSYAGFGDRGIEASGNEVGGLFRDADHSGLAYVGFGDVGIVASGSSSGAAFTDSDASGGAVIGMGDRGIEGYGNEMGGFFRDRDSAGFAYVGKGDRGLEGYGNEMGGFFSDLNNSGFARVAWLDYGVAGYGNSAGGYFEDTNGSGYATVGVGDRGIQGFGNEMGGYFKDLDNSGYAVLGSGNRGIEAVGSEMAGHFQDQTATATADLAGNGRGIDAQGITFGGRFSDPDDSGFALLALGNIGVLAHGTYEGGFFEDNDSFAWARVGRSSYTLQGNGVKSFVQNHPTDPNLVVVYHAPEGSEVAVYTRGSGIVSGGQAIVDLDPTFAWVANPDLGLTAHVTPRGSCPSFFVESVTTASLVVRCDSPAGGVDLPFDYLIYGLRIGFEAMAPVQPKDEEAFIPSMQDQRDMYASRPELSQYNALERFMGMAAEASRGGDGGVPVDLSRAHALVAQIGEYDPAVHGPVGPSRDEIRSATPLDPRVMAPTDPVRPGMIAGAPAAPGPVRRTEPAVPPAGPTPPRTISEEPLLMELPPGATWLPVSEPVEEGDVLILDPDDPALLRRASSAADPTVVGVALGASRQADGAGRFEAPLAVSGIVLVRADAVSGAIRPGDLLTTSGTPGHAARAVDLAPGTILGKALDALPGGAGTIRAVILLR